MNNYHIDFYVSTPTIREFCNKYGAHAEKLDKVERVSLMAAVAAYSSVLVTVELSEDEIPSEVYTAFEVGFGIDAEDWFKELGNTVGSLNLEQTVRFVQALADNFNYS